MKLIFTIGLALGLALGAVTQASATTPISCAQEWTGSKTKTCKDETGTKVEVDVDASAKAIAEALAQQAQQQGQIQGQQQGQIAEGGDAYNGGNSVQISNPSTVRTFGASVVLNLDAAELLDGPNKRANRTAMSYGALGYPETGKAVLDTTYWGKKAQKKIEESGGALCQMTKDGVLQVNRYTNIAQCKAYHGVK